MGIGATWMYDISKYMLLSCITKKNKSTKTSQWNINLELEKIKASDYSERITRYSDSENKFYSFLLGNEKDNVANQWYKISILELLVIVNCSTDLVIIQKGSEKKY